MPKPITAYECIHGCRKFYKTEKAMVKHEATCICNVDNRTCRTCAYDAHDEDGCYCGADADKHGKQLILHCNQWSEKGVEF